jgi:hypothetical protein
MTEFNHFNFFTIFSDDLTMTEQLRWINHMLRELIEADSFIWL